MDLRLKIGCTCYCSYCVSDKISEKEVRCPNCGRIPSYSAKLIEMLNVAKEIPDVEKLEGGKDISIHVLSIEEQMSGA